MAAAAGPAVLPKRALLFSPWCSELPAAGRHVAAPISTLVSFEGAAHSSQTGLMT